MADKKILKTRICEMLGIEYPIFLAGMGWTSGPTLVAAVSNAGGLGVLGATNLTPEEARTWIQQTKRLTDKPFGLNLILPPDIASDDAPADFKQLIPKKHLEFVKSIMEELGLPGTEAHVPWEKFNYKAMQEIGRICVEEKIALFGSGLGNPAWIIPEAHEIGMLVSACVGNTKNAKRLSDSGVDILIAQGFEGGGHTGRIGTMSLVPNVIDAVTPTVVMAAGGIADGRGLAAALAMGADGVWIGTAFVATHEANVDILKLHNHFYSDAWIENWQKSIIEAVDEGTVVSKISSGKTARHVRNLLIDYWDKSDFSYLPLPLQGILVWDLYRNISHAGLTDYMPHLSGQGASLIKEIRSAEEVVNSIVEEAVEILTEKIPQQVKFK